MTELKHFNKNNLAYPGSVVPLSGAGIVYTILGFIVWNNHN
jgi:hypothetical protein